MNKIVLAIALLTLQPLQGLAQKKVDYNLGKMFLKHGLDGYPDTTVTLADTASGNVVSCKGIAWLKGVHLTEGTIDVDIRGRDVFLQSFLGIAFHAEDTARYEVVFFRPFNFRHADTARRKWSVQYMLYPDFMYDKLRREHPLTYEYAVNPVPEPAGWFHATIVVKQGYITVYINHSQQASLHVKTLGDLNGRKIGLWDDPDGLPGDFANLSITK